MTDIIIKQNSFMLIDIIMTKEFFHDDIYHNKKEFCFYDDRYHHTKEMLL